VAVAAIAAIHVFWGRGRKASQVHPHEAPLTMLLPALVMVILGLLFALVPTWVDPMLGVAVHAISPGFDVATVTTSYDFVPVLKAMLASIFFGGVILFNWNRLGRLLDRIHPLHKIGPESWYWRSLELLPLLAARQTRLLQHGRLPRYLLSLIGAATMLTLWLLFSARPHWTLPELQTLTAPVLGASLLIAAGALVAIFVRDHLVLLLVSGLVGYGCAVLFLFTGAPDLAFTQFAVETIFVVVVAAVLLRLRRMPLGVRMAPAEARLRPPALGIAIAFGATLTALVLIVSGLPYDSTLADFYGEHSLTAAHGRNVVNLILVDFRALDTLGEIAVLAFALLAALPLLKRLGGRQP
jgi:multicomponent Na+:H+ antiporter subunit A